MALVGNVALARVWAKVKGLVAASAATKQDKLVSGTSLKTVNGQTLLGAGDVTIDLSLFKVVDALPSAVADINAEKIYLVKSAAQGEGNVYTEHVYTGDLSAAYDASKWEKLGEYKSDVDLTPYVRFTDLATAKKAGAMSAADKAKLDGLKNYTLPAATKTALGGVKVGTGLAVAADGTLSATGGGTADAVEWDNVLNKPGNASASADGLMSKADKAKLDGISEMTEADVDEICV